MRWMGCLPGVKASIRFTLLLALFTCVGSHKPAFAGYYSVYPESGSGSVTTTPTGGGSSYTESLAGPDYSTQTMGSVSYSYTETWRYSWEPESEEIDDEPVDTTVNITGAVQFDFMVTSGGEYYPEGGASGSATFGDNVASATMSYSSGGSSESGTGVPQELRFEQHLSGWDGTFTVTYQMAMSTSEAVLGSVVITRNAGGSSGVKYIYVTAPKRGSNIAGAPAQGILFRTVTVSGVWKLPGGAGGFGATRPWRVRLDGNGIDQETQPPPTTTLGVYSPNVWNTWSIDNDWIRPNAITVTAWLEWETTSGQWTFGTPESAYSSSTNFNLQ